MTIEEILEDMKVPFLHAGEHHHCRPGWIQLDCPFCGKDTQRFHLGWNLALNYTNCWKCGGHHPDQVFKELGLSTRKAADLARTLDTTEAPKRERTQISYAPPGGLGPLLGPHKRYLRGRGFDWREMQKIWQIQGIGLHTRYSWRVFIPIILRDVAVSWTSRSISSKAKQRYLSASAEEEAINHKHLLYGEDYCYHSIVVVEGPTDAWRIGPGAGALFGTAFTSAQVNRIVQHPCRYICFDSSPEAQARADELASELSAFPGITENIQLDAEDPGSASEKEIRLLRKAARL